MKISTSVLLLSFLLGAWAVADPVAAPDPAPGFAPGTRILFQGDSITDMNRGRGSDPNHLLGHSYAFLIGARFGALLPERHLTFINRGISGNKVSDLKKRWQTDTLDLHPDILSILIGVNDLNGNVSADAYEQQYDQLLTDTLEVLPKVRLVLLEPFGLPTGKKKEGWDDYHGELQKRQAIVARLAGKHHAVLVKIQAVFDEACSRAPAEYWIWDGVHPTFCGQQLIADEWMKTVNAASTGH